MRVAAVGLTIGVTAAGAGTAAAQTATAQTLETGQYQTLDHPGVTEMRPADGRLAGYGFETDITGVAFTARAGGPSDTPVVAAPGDQLVVISISQAMPDQSRYYAYPANSSPTYTLTAGTTRITLGQVDQSVPAPVDQTSGEVSSPGQSTAWPDESVALTGPPRSTISQARSGGGGGCRAGSGWK